jgi:hypothetical protein
MALTGVCSYVFGRSGEGGVRVVTLKTQAGSHRCEDAKS